MKFGKFLAAGFIFALLAVYHYLPELESAARGGTVARLRITLALSKRDKGVGEADAAARAAEVVRRRLARLGAVEAHADADGPAELSVVARGSIDPAELKKVLAWPGRFELRIVDESPEAEEATRMIPRPSPAEMPHGGEILLDSDGRPRVVGRKAVLIGHISRASADNGRLGGQLMFHLDPDGAATLATASKAYLKKKLAIVVDGVVYATPMLAAPILKGDVVVEPLSDVLARELAAVLDSGPLPAPVIGIVEAR